MEKALGFGQTIGAHLVCSNRSYNLVPQHLAQDQPRQSPISVSTATGLCLHRDQTVNLLCIPISLRSVSRNYKTKQFGHLWERQHKATHQV